MKITKRVREEAALLCAIAASNSWHQTDDEELEGRISAAIPPHDTPAGELAWKLERITWQAWRKSPYWTPEAHWAEAEALLRTGWTP